MNRKQAEQEMQRMLDETNRIRQIEGERTKEAEKITAGLQQEKEELNREVERHWSH